MKKRVVISVTNDIATDQRVKRTAFTFVDQGYEVTVLGRRMKRSLPVKWEAVTTIRFRFWVNQGPLFYALVNLRLFFYLLIHKADIIFANDLDTLLPAYLISRIKKIPLIYDSHEYFTGVPELEHNKFAKSVWTAIEQFIFPRLSHCITVNNSIAELYEKQYGIKPRVIRNVPLKFDRLAFNKQETLRKYHLPEKHKIFILQGAGINVDRGAEEAVLAMQWVEGALLLIIGGGDIFHLLPSLINEKKLGDKVRLHDKVDSDELKKITASCFAGLTLDRDTNINYRLSLPNKIFDYIQACIPVIASDLPEISRIVSIYGTGIIVTPHHPEVIARAMNKLLADSTYYDQLRQNAVNASQELSWEKEKGKLIAVILAASTNKS